MTEKENPLDKPLITVRFVCADDSVIERTWTYRDNPDPKFLKTVPNWLQNPLKAWPKPQDPITFSGTVAEGHEEDARAFVESL